MQIKTESDGNWSTVTICDSGKKFRYELQINNSGDVYNLLTVEKDGTINNEKPTLE
jgi:hypothetical protein